MELSGKVTLTTVMVVILFCDSLFSLRIPEPQISNLSQWATINVAQICGDNCYSYFNNVSCNTSRVCRDGYECNGRSGEAPVEYPLTEWSLDNNSDGCRVTSNESTSLPAIFLNDNHIDKTLVVNGSADDITPCFTHRNGSVDSIFTLVFWLMAKCQNCSILDIRQSVEEPVHIRVIRDQICVHTNCTEVQQNLEQEWVMISVRVVRNQLTIFVNDTPLQIPDDTLADVVDVYVGSEENAAIEDVFRLRYIQYYRDALTSRELKVKRTNLTDHVTHPDCYCPVDYPEDTGDNNCTNRVTYYPRYNTTVIYNNASATLDGDLDTFWASSDQGNVTLMLNLNTSFQIEAVLVTFRSTLPYQATYSLFVGGQKTRSGYFQCANSTCMSNMTHFDSTPPPMNLSAYTADEIQIELHRQDSTKTQNFIITSINITGRCDCSGNAENCTVNYEHQTYTCSCAQETNTQGQGCQSCVPNFFRPPGKFDCPNSCQCNKDGVVNASNQCEEAGGKCICKKNVEGEVCDTCKPFSFNFSGGCPTCNCDRNNSISCSNTTGICTCKANTQPPYCNKCSLYSYGFNNPEGCQPCNCSTAGTKNLNRTCNDTGQCECKENIQGLTCDECRPGYYDLETANQEGCKKCECHPVGIEVNSCSAVNGQCHCRGGIITDERCTPEITSVDPTYGPQVGGTLVTIRGRQLGNWTDNLEVFFNDTRQDVIIYTDTMVVFNTTMYNVSTSQPARQLKLSWKKASPLNPQITFTYMENPVLDISKAQNVSTFVSGGCQVYIYGTNLQSVKYPKLEVALSANPENKTTAICRHTTGYIVCPTPNVRSLYTSPQDHFKIAAVFDGVYIPNIGNIDVHPDPHMDNVGTIKFQYPFEDTIFLGGKGLRAACQEDEFSVLIGVIRCAIKYISDTGIECTPAASPPGDYTHLPIQVNVGNLQFTVGTLQYLELRETTGFIAIICSISAAIIITVAIIVGVIWWRRRRNKAPSHINNMDNKHLVAEETRTIDAYQELPVRAEETAIVENGHFGLIQKETVFQEPKKGIVNTEAEDSTLTDEFLPKVDVGLREDIRLCFIGAGHFVLGRHCAIKGKQAQLIDGSLQKGGTPAVKLTIKSLTHPVTESHLPAWGNLALSECLRLRKYKHTHVLSLLGIGINKDQFHILYPRMSQYILKTMISDAGKEFSVRQLLSLGQQVAEGIKFLASKDFTHKDVAARNCMVDENSVVKLCDSAFSWDFFENEYVYDEHRERYLPIRWMAPESITDGYYDMRTDVWSFAVLVWELLTRGCLPYHEAISSKEVSDFITQGYILGKPDILSDNVFDLLSSCWSHENEQRPSIAAVSKSLGDILETEDDGTYANAGEAVAHLMQNTHKNAMKLKQSPDGQDSKYGTSKLSRV